MEPFVTGAWLAAHRDEVTLADVRLYLDGRSGHDAYAAGHLPGAVYVDLEAVLSDPPGDRRRGRHPLPDPERFAAGLQRAGIGEHDTVIGYDDAGGVIAARLIWLLRVTGHRAALLTGDPRPQFTDRPTPAPTAAKTFTPQPWPADRLATIDEVAELSAALAAGSGPQAGSGSTTLIDARPPERFDGAPDTLDPRPGHIPGAINVPARGATLDGLVGVRELVSYCGSGVTACFNMLRAEQFGIPARLYPGSWSEWSRDPDRPVA